MYMGIIDLSDVSQALQEQYGTEGVAELGLELFVESISKMFDTLQEAYKGILFS